jgi:hypothetical protein
MWLKQYYQTRVKKPMVAIAGASLILGVVLPISAASAQAQTGSSNQASSNSARSILEVDVTNNSSLNNGQPQIAVNPRDPDNLVFISTADNLAITGVDRFHCFVAYSTDRGVTWTPVTWPLGDLADCGNPELAVDSQGVFYVEFNRFGNCLQATCSRSDSSVGVARSLDGGRTWSDPVNTPLNLSASPRVLVDTATDYLYVEGSVNGVTTPNAVSVSKDHGLTWSPIAQLPSQPFGNQIAVHDGILAAVTAQQLVLGGPLGFQIVPTVPMFSVSFDNGQTWTSSQVTDSEGLPVPPPTGPLVPDIFHLITTDPIPWISADPTRRGRFAVMVPRADNPGDNQLEVYITNDAGQTWTGPAVIPAPNAFKPWIAFGPTGLLGVMWRTTAVDAYSVVSFDGGRSFSAPLRVNQATKPAGVELEGGDKYSHLVFSGKYVYVTWSDGRTGGDIDGIMSRVPLSLYRCGLLGNSNPVGQGCLSKF